MASSRDGGRSLRIKARRHYNEGEHQDDEIEGRRTWNLDRKISDEKFTTSWVKVMSGQEFTMKFLQEGGFETPMLFKSTEGLGIKIPGKEFTVNDVKLHVGSRRMVDVMDVNTQKGVEMSMAQFAKYYENKEREQLYNVISLEFSHTKLEEYVEAPSIVRQIDWVDVVWPQHLKKGQRDSTNTLAVMKYPKVQKYCLMSVAGCYTDFHIDFGGTSVWYHILHGKKIFWLIPPSEDNLELYENWVLSGKQADIFLGDRVKECTKIVLEAGYTFMIPSGWIHAVYTPEDSLVFGGNILHSFHIHRQLRVAQIEDRTHVPSKFRYPFFWEMKWFALERYVHTLTGKTFLGKAEPEASDGETQEATDRANADGEDAKTTAAETHLGQFAEVASPADTDKTEEMDLEAVERSEVSPAPVDQPLEEARADEDEDDDKSPADAAVSNGDYRPVSAASLLCSPSTRDAAFKAEAEFLGDVPPETVDRVKAEPGRRRTGGGEDEDKEVITSSAEAERRSGRPHISLCRHELIGLRVLHHQLDNLPHNKRAVPDLILDPDGLLQSAKEMLAEHLEDSQGMAVTGVPVLSRPKAAKTRLAKVARHKPQCGMRPVSKRVANGIRRRRTRCRKCENCLSEDCRSCHYCKDMKKYGGPGRMKQSCVARQCLYPMLPHNAVCAICTREERQGSLGVKGDSEVSSLMECHSCNEIVHPECQAEQVVTDHEGVINEDLANSWECPKCVAKTEAEEEDEQHEEVDQNDKPGKRKKEESCPETPSEKKKRGRPPLKRPEFKGNSLLGKSRVIGPMGFFKGRTATRQQLLAKQKVHQAKMHSMRGKHRQARESEARAETGGRPSPEPSPEEAGRTPDGGRETEEDTGESSPPPPPVIMEKRPATVFPSFVVRPLPSTQLPRFFGLADGRLHPAPMDVWLRVFGLLGPADLCRCLCVCRTWNRWCFQTSLWPALDASRIPLGKYVLAGIVRRQPASLDLSGSAVSRRQLSWLVARLPALRALRLARVSPDALPALCSAACPQLHLLDLAWAGLQDAHLAALLAQIRDHRPGLCDDRSKLQRLRELRLAGADVTDLSLGLLTERTQALTCLDLSYCGNITSQGIADLLSAESPLIHSLTELDLTGCHQLTDASLACLRRCRKLRKVAASSCPRLDGAQWREWAADSGVALEL